MINIQFSWFDQFNGYKRIEQTLLNEYFKGSLVNEFWKRKTNVEKYNRITINGYFFLTGLP